MDKSSYKNDEVDLPNEIVLKQDMLVELIGGNVATDDGLVNGAEGIFKQYKNVHILHSLD